MSQACGWRDVHDGVDCAVGRACGDHDAVLRALAERICPISSGDRHTDAHRYFGQDLVTLPATDLALEAARATFRLCLEPQGPDRQWLVRRLERIRAEQAARVDEDERQREEERRDYETWLRWNAAQNRTVER